MNKKRINRKPEDKLSMVLEALMDYQHGDFKKTAHKNGVDPSVLSRWYRKLITPESAELIYGRKRKFYAPTVNDKDLLDHMQKLSSENIRLREFLYIPERNVGTHTV